MPLRKIEKAILWILVLSFLLWQGYRVWKDWPVYASPMALVDSFDELKEYLEQSGRTFVLPEPFWEDVDQVSYEVGLDGRTRKARATGYSIGVNCDGIQKGVSFSYVKSSPYPAEIRSESYTYETYKTFYSTCALESVRISASAMVPKERLTDGGEELERSMQEWTYAHCEELVDAYLQVEPEAAAIALPEMYRSFLDGEALLERATPLPLQKGREPYTLTELARGWQDSLAEQNNGKTLSQVSYALVDFMEFRTDLGPYGGEKVTCYQEIRYSGLSQPYIPLLYLSVDSTLQDLPSDYPQDIAGEERTGPYTLHVYYLSNPEGVWPIWPFYAFSKEEDGAEYPAEPQPSYREWYRSAGIDVRTMDEAEEGIIACYETFGIAADHWNDPSISWTLLQP